MNARLIAVLCLSGLAVLFVIQNVPVVEVTLLFWTISMSRALLIFFTLAIGLLLGWFLHSYVTYRREKNDFSEDI
jgi:lipopolysaccharide assembly protein A